MCLTLRHPSPHRPPGAAPPGPFPEPRSLMDVTALFDEIKDDLTQVEHHVHTHLSTEIPLLNEVGRYILNSGGKRLRPAILIFSARMFGTPDSRTYTAAGALEYLHTATLLHDDVVDEAETRRAQAAARMVWGNPASVLVGDYLLATAFRALTGLGNLGVLDTISDVTSMMAKGEILQLIRRYDSATEADYLAIIINKTACLFAAAAKIGAAFSGAGPEHQDALYRYGMDVGIAFQIVDDALDYVEDRTKVGKPLGVDLKERKVTLPLSRLLQVAGEDERRTLLDILGRERIEDPDVHEVVAMMRRHDVLAYTLGEARGYAERGRAHLADLPDLPERETLAHLAEFVVHREF